MFTIRQPAATARDNRTWFTCPHCGHGSVFFNKGAPDECEDCMGGLPNFIGMLMKGDIARKAYFNGGFLGSWEIGNEK